MKKRLYKNKKQRSRLKVVFYSTEGSTNPGCTYNDGCNVGELPETFDGTNYRCNPPKSTRDGARNIRCNLAVNC
jgi:hypothetical protein